MAEWTPGPWEVVRDPVDDDGCFEFCIVQDEDGSLAHLARDINGAANARLIAAAPEMAELLQDWLNRWRSAVSTDYNRDFDAETEALLARIKGANDGRS